MPLVSDPSSYGEGISDLTDIFAIKNFVVTDQSHVIPDHSLDEPLIFKGFMLAICLKGKAVLRVNYKDITFKEGEIFTYMPCQIFRIKERSDNFLIETLFLSADFVLSLSLPKDFDLLKRMNIEPVQQINAETMHNMLEFHTLITRYYRRNDNPYKELQTKALIFALLMEVSISYSQVIPPIPSTVSRQEQLTENFFNLMLEEYKKERSVAYYADKLCLTPKYLSMSIKKITGHPISEWINTAVIIESKRLLKATDLTVLQISEELNFPNPSFFGRFFKQYTGITPLKYKSS